MKSALSLLRPVTRAPARIGLLWDSLSKNLGDQAIGLCLLRLARRAGIDDLTPVPIGSPIAASQDLLVIGGGELLHPESHGYYDLFRVPGRHILNTVGTGGELDATYLDSYRLVSVRSEADRSNLRNLQRDVTVAPCLTVLFDRILEPSERLDLPEGAIGIHLHPSSFRLGEGRGVLQAVRQLGDRCVLIPFTHYNQDREVQSVVAQQLDLPPPLPVTSPDQAFEAVRRLGGMVTTSLHATIMAYIAGVPFVAVAYAPKVTHFLRERDLAHRLVGSVVEVTEKLDLLKPGSVEWQDRLEIDRRRAEELLAAILSELDDALKRPAPRGRSLAGWRQPTHPRESHGLMMKTHENYGLRIAERLAHAYERERFAAHREQIEGEVTKLKDELERARGYSESLESQLREVKEELDKAAPYARSLEQQLGSSEGRRRGPTNLPKSGNE